MKRVLPLSILLVLILLGGAACSFLKEDDSPSEGCLAYANIQEHVVEVNSGNSMGRQNFKQGEVLVVQVELVGESNAGVRVARLGGEIVAESESVPTTLRYEIQESGVDIFPITNLGPGSISISVSCE